MQRIKTKDIATYRQLYATEQQNICPLCSKDIQDPVLEHDHVSGRLRGTTCRKCNSALGAIENAGKRYGIPLATLIQITKNFEQHINNTKPVLHPTHLTPEEKAARTKRKAKRRRENAKKAKTEKTQPQKGE